MKSNRLLLFAVMSALVFTAGCTKESYEVTQSRPIADESSSSAEEENFYERWQGENITAHVADINGCIMIGEGDNGAYLWQDFIIDVGSSAKAEVTVCTEDSVMHVAENSSGSTALIQIKEKSEDRVVSRGKLVSPVEICCVRNNDTDELEYYLSDCLLYTVKSYNNDEYNDIPAEFDSFQVSSDAAVTFPFQKRFSNIDDFDSFYEMYHNSLGLDNMKEQLTQYNEEGGFNTHVVFLYGDLSSGDAKYELFRTVRNGDELTFYLRRTSSDRTNTVAKWLLTCTVPSEYLSDVSPDKVKWVIYDDEESRG